MSAQSRFNLIVGGVLGFSGFAVLGMFIYVGIGGTGDTLSRVIYVGGRLSLVIMIQVFAYFFLNLYRVGISEIKYFENEMTNFESKVLGLIGARQTNDTAALAKIYADLGGTERNFVLKKGESTIALRRDEIDQSHLENLAGALVSTIKVRLGGEAEENKGERRAGNRGEH